MSEHIATRLEGGVLELRINRPEKRNALTRPMYAAMAEALEAAAENPAVRAVLLCGSGDGFCAGNDLADFVSGAPPLGEESPSRRFLRAISTHPKPIVAAVQGNAVGIGTTMLLHCDLVVLAENARLALPFVKLGVVPEAASSLLLPRLTGHQRAAEMMLLGEPIDAATAREIGIANRVVAADALMATAHGLAAKLAAQPPTALLLTKALLKAGQAEIAARMDEEGRLFTERLQSDELKEAVAAFFEKRAPNFG
jgi:enoyl-CoA hydratase/carnithine racemase